MAQRQQQSRHLLYVVSVIIAGINKPKGKNGKKRYLMSDRDLLNGQPTSFSPPVPLTNSLQTHGHEG